MEEYIEKLKIFEEDPRFKFDEEAHKYTYLSEDLSRPIQTFVSATQIIDSFKEPFDSDYWSKKKAEDRGVSQEIILNEWNEKGQRSAHLGTKVHEWIEHHRAGNNPEIPTEETDDIKYSIPNRVKLFKSFYDSRLYKLTPLRQEFRVFSRKWNIAGTMDDLSFIEGQDGLIIGDWKTNAALKTDLDFKGRYKKLLYPFEDLYENDLNKYSIQVSLYRTMLEEVGIKTVDGFICWISPTGVKLYKTLDLRERLKTYLNKNNLSI